MGEGEEVGKGMEEEEEKTCHSQHTYPHHTHLHQTTHTHQHHMNLYQTHRTHNPIIPATPATLNTQHRTGEYHNIDV